MGRGRAPAKTTEESPESAERGEPPRCRCGVDKSPRPFTAQPTRILRVCDV